MPTRDEPEIVGFKFYRTKEINVKKTAYTVRFSVSKDGEKYILFVSNNQNNKEKKYHIDKETAVDFNKKHGVELTAMVEKLIEQDIRNNLI